MPTWQENEPETARRLRESLQPSIDAGNLGMALQAAEHRVAKAAKFIIKDPESCTGWYFPNGWQHDEFRLALDDLRRLKGEG